MVKRLCLVLSLAALLCAMPGCRVAAPVLESWGGCPGGGGCCGGPPRLGCDTKTRAMMRQWGADARRGERTVDTYLFNYDINDPYRGDCVVGY